MRNTKSIYIHIPFCIKKCFYCDFYSEEYEENLIEPYVNALIKEINQVENSFCEIETIYFGGGTPSIIPAIYIGVILEEIKKKFKVSKNSEITLEVNPATADLDKLRKLKEVGINRLSIGCQSFSNKILKKLGRIHNENEAISLYENARITNFENVSIDLMFALPCQSLSDLKESLNTLITLNPEHISIYELSFEKDTPFGDDEKNLKNFVYEDPSEMTDLIEKTLIGYGYIQYEISNFAKKGFKSRHNQIYWKNEEYYGFGAGSVDFDGINRTKKIDNLYKYISFFNENKNENIICFQEILKPKERAFEIIMLGLRMNDGFDLRNATTYLSSQEIKILYEKISSMQDMLCLKGNVLKTTPKGARFLNDLLINIM